MCSEAHQRDPRNINVLRDRAEAYILNQEYEKGERVSIVGHLLQKTRLCFPYMLCYSSFACLDRGSMVLQNLYSIIKSGMSKTLVLNLRVFFNSCGGLPRG